MILYYIYRILLRRKIKTRKRQNNHRGAVYFSSNRAKFQSFPKLKNMRKDHFIFTGTTLINHYDCRESTLVSLHRRMQIALSSTD